MERMGEKFLQYGSFANGQDGEETPKMDIIEDIDHFICKLSDDISDKFYEMKDILQEADHDTEAYEALRRKYIQIRHIAEILSLNVWELREKVHQARCISKDIPITIYMD